MSAAMMCRSQSLHPVGDPKPHTHRGGGGVHPMPRGREGGDHAPLAHVYSPIPTHRHILANARKQVEGWK